MARKKQQVTVNIAATIDYREFPDVEEPILTFVFRGASQHLVEEVFRFLVGNGKGIAPSVIVGEEHDVVRRNGKGYYRIAVNICQPNYNFSSLDDMKLLIEATFHRLQLCNFSWLSLNKFLNV